MRPGMYAQPVDVVAVESYLHGLETGCHLAGLTIARDLYEKAAASRGWRKRAAGITWNMRAKKPDDGAAIQELILVQQRGFSTGCGTLFIPARPCSAGINPRRSSIAARAYPFSSVL